MKEKAPSEFNLALVASLTIGVVYRGSVIGSFEIVDESGIDINERISEVINGFVYDSIRHWEVYFDELDFYFSDDLIEQIVPREHNRGYIVAGRPIFINHIIDPGRRSDIRGDIPVEIAVETAEAFIFNQTVHADEFSNHYGMPKIPWLHGSNTARYPKWLQKFIKEQMPRREYASLQSWWGYGVSDGPGMLHRIDDPDWYMKRQMGWQEFDMTADAQAEEERRKIEALVDIVSESVQAHAGEMARVTADVARDVAKDMGYSNVTAMIGAGVREAMEALQIGRVASWLQGKAVSLFAPPERKLLPWKEKRP